ncbi:accessory regulator AgrB [Clostridium chromiireducens]|uniref:Accessory regulator AgrB n=1 Tax=Clostridium chromiireducens TaxID=225345 RepID=A0A399IYR5_9CLOT|nr:accessory gene regulator B family protein [Clostridium chromiireducens]RII35896.1 accessory regulator AgrB [Clostridium chromiireducens]
MLRIESICENISNYIANELKFDNNKRDIINYGIFALMQMGICIGLVIIFGIILNVLIEALIISFTISILRKSSGGVHASSPRRCAIIGTVSSIGMGLIAKYMNLNLNLTIMSGGCIFIWSYYIIYKLAPVDSKSKPIKSSKKRGRLKKNSIVILSVYLIIILVEITYFYFTEESKILVYSLCIYMGVLWQVCSLTKYGHQVMAKLNKLFK